MDTSNWLKEWAVPLSAGATFLLAIAAFWAIWQNYKFRREDRSIHSLYRIRNWAEKSIQLLTIAIPTDLSKAKEALKQNIQIIRAESLSALADAELLGGEIKQNVQKVVHNFSDFTDKAGKSNQSVDLEALLKNLLGDFLNVINSASK